MVAVETFIKAQYFPWIRQPLQGTCSVRGGSNGDLCGPASGFQGYGHGRGMVGFTGPGDDFLAVPGGLREWDRCQLGDADEPPAATFHGGADAQGEWVPEGEAV